MADTNGNSGTPDPHCCLKVVEGAEEPLRAVGGQCQATGWLGEGGSSYSSHIQSSTICVACHGSQGLGVVLTDWRNSIVPQGKDTEAEGNGRAVSIAASSHGS